MKSYETNKFPLVLIQWPIGINDFHLSAIPLITGIQRLLPSGNWHKIHSRWELAMETGIQRWLPSGAEGKSFICKWKKSSTYSLYCRFVPLRRLDKVYWWSLLMKTSVFPLLSHTNLILFDNFFLLFLRRSLHSVLINVVKLNYYCTLS